jgi:CheY-like chemotaxis protein
MPTVLYAEDRPDNDLVEYLETEGFTVLIAENGGQALNSLKTQEVDVILLDIMMPAGDELCDDPHIDGGFKTGLAVLRWLESQHMTVPVVVLSANPATSVSQEAERSPLVGKLIRKGGRTSLAEIVAALHEGALRRHEADERDS